MRREARSGQGPVLTLDAGDYSMGTPFAAASRELGGELQLMGRMGYDATTFGNHEFDLGPEGLGQAIDVAARAGHPRRTTSASTSPRSKNSRPAKRPAASRWTTCWSPSLQV